MEDKGIVFDIQRFSVHDGPGIRSIVFLKGCPLRCRWCSNPESQSKEPQIMFVKRNCIGCGRCTELCPTGALQIVPTFKIDESKCTKCGICVEACYSEALNFAGNPRSVQDVINELKKDHIHYKRSGGGITLSGGEPLSQPYYAEELLKACKEKGWHTAIETTAFTSQAVLEQVLPWLDLVLLDIKHTDERKHLEFVGRSNEKILENAKFIGQFGVPIIIRVPVIPTFNDGIDEMETIASFASNIRGVKEMHLLPYHRLGENKYDYLNYEYEMKGIPTPTNEKMQKLKTVVEEKGLICKIGG
ncbi:glycyl-radical enzyme activating protein [Robertmurraya massiliosenegalensis]|uniref:glycyl-radical enzyme activating protein n=1 Tax=Robertmurraya massiliosenegalensis TaxID=1287657 RepID=UPI0002E1A453|nr:glycyl-radical enzyme activating protein [Robertmurraya massiliosenegalensis]